MTTRIMRRHTCVTGPTTEPDCYWQERAPVAIQRAVNSMVAGARPHRLSVRTTRGSVNRTTIHLHDVTGHGSIGRTVSPETEAMALAAMNWLLAQPS